MSHYSVAAWSPVEAGWASHGILVGVGSNAFTFRTENIAQVLADLTEAGVKVHRVHLLDEAPAEQSEGLYQLQAIGA